MHGNLCCLYTQCLRYNICSAWFLDTVYAENFAVWNFCWIASKQDFCDYIFVDHRSPSFHVFHRLVLPHGYKIFNGPSSLPSSVFTVNHRFCEQRVRSIVNQYIQGNSRALGPCSKSYEYFPGPVAIAMHWIVQPHIKNNMHAHEMIRGMCTDRFYISL